MTVASQCFLCFFVCCCFFYAVLVRFWCLSVAFFFLYFILQVFVYESNNWLPRLGKGNLFIINAFTEKCVFADFSLFTPILSSLLSFFFFFLFLSIYLLRFWYLSQSKRPLDLNILFASSLPLHNNVKHASNNRKENGRERARAEEIEAKFFFFLSWLCPISFLFFPMNFWISFIAN